MAVLGIQSGGQLATAADHSGPAQISGTPHPSLMIHPSPARNRLGTAGGKRSTLRHPQPQVVNLTGLALPVLAFEAYHHAASLEAQAAPSCHLPWWILAGIGHTESGNAEGGRLFADGTTRGRILGPRLDGHLPGNAIIRDTDHGVLDGDTEYDRAVGPMQFIPSTWRSWQADGNHDGRRDPNNIFDSTLAAAGYLCAEDRDLATPSSINAAVLSYNNSQDYLTAVLAWGHAYRDGATAVSDISQPVITDVTAVRPPLASRPPQAAPPLTRRTGTSQAAVPHATPTTTHPLAGSSPTPVPPCPTTDTGASASSPAVSSQPSPSATPSASLASTVAAPADSGPTTSPPTAGPSNPSPGTSSPRCAH